MPVWTTSPAPLRMTYMVVSRVYSKETALGERDRLRGGNDDVIEHPHVDQCERALQRLRQELVGARRLGQPRRVVVREDHRAGVEHHRPPDDLAGIDAGLRQR